MSERYSSQALGLAGPQVACANGGPIATGAGAIAPAVRCSLIIVTKGRPAPLGEVLDSAARALPPDGEVIVVDGDPERSAERVVGDLLEQHPEHGPSLRGERAGHNRATQRGH